ncbi:hypothetical protein AX15_005989 [Amanita polypyramis BW_CC]|nr:hypothetical protein AX15_005989 [Amanita polypyramis BW_CC]
MIRTCSRGLQKCAFSRHWTSANFCSSSIAAIHQPNPPLQLDPSLEALLKDVDMSLVNHKKAPFYKELEIFPGELLDTSEALESNRVESAEDDIGPSRKSPAAEFGSHRIGAVVLPSQLTNSINQLIQESNKALLHVDAKRLFLSEDGTESGERGWGTQYEARYRSKSQSARHAQRDGIAFASIAFPAHYSAIIAVLNHVRRRLGPSWTVQDVVDWGAAAGSGLWASVHSFQILSPEEGPTEAEYFRLSDSSISSYTGVDKRDGLISIGKRLMNGIDCGKLQIRWRKSFEKESMINGENKEMLALSAFLLSTLSTSVARKMLVKEMWESGAEVIVLIDHKTAAGFDAIAEAREYLLKLGKKELEDLQDQDVSSAKGSHVIAPCPHDGSCPLFQGGSSRLACGLSQRIQRPDFMRRTKHSKIGHEDIEYSYIAIRRGPRPPMVTTQTGRVGEVGLQALQQSAVGKIPIKELFLHDSPEESTTPIESDVPTETEDPTLPVIKNQEELEVTLRQEAFNWPRLVFPPLKRSGHVILDGCTVEGKIMRMIIPRSQGKQPYYDARKSRWGDIFPHQPKNPGQERHLGPKGKQDNHVKGKLETSGYEESDRLSHKQRRKPRRYYLERLLSQTE